MPMPADELCALLGISTRTLRSWIRAGVVPRPPFRGRATVYADSTVLRAQAAAALRRENVPLPFVRLQLNRASVEELRVIAGLPPVSAPEASAPPPAAAEAPIMAPPERAGIAWRRVELLPGLELHVREDAGAVIERMAADIAAARWAPPEPARNAISE